MEEARRLSQVAYGTVRLCSNQTLVAGKGTKLVFRTSRTRQITVIFAQLERKLNSVCVLSDTV